MENNLVIILCPLVDPDLKIRGGGRGGGGHLDPEIRGARSQKKFFSALWASVWSKNKGGRGRPPRASPLDRH